MSSHDVAPGRPTLHHPSAGARPWALVTGASGGIGEAFALHLAAHGTNVALAARTVHKLEDVAGRVRDRGVRALVLPCDVGQRSDRDALLDELEAQHVQVDTLVNNAGFGLFGEVVEHDLNRVQEMVEVNCTALTHLTGALLPGMLERRRGVVINVASTAAFQPLPGMAAYAATKAYVRSYTEALWSEVRESGVQVVALCPGPTSTDFFENAGDGSALRWRRTPEQVVESCFRGLAAGRPTVVDGWFNRVQSWAPRLVPTRLALAAATRVINGHR